MLYTTPSADQTSQRKLAELDELRRRLSEQVGSPTRWSGPLRRSFRAADIGSSTAIEGFTVTEDDALALVDGHTPADPEDHDRMAVSGYARAMSHVNVMATDPTFTWTDRVIKDLHFDACSSTGRAIPAGGARGQ